MKHLPFDRSERVAEEVRQIVATACLTDIDDPRLMGIEITRVRMTRDLSIARIFFSMSVPERQHEARAALEESAALFKRAINRELRLKFMPTIEVFYDDTVDAELRVEELLRQTR